MIIAAFNIGILTLIFFIIGMIKPHWALFFLKKPDRFLDYRHFRLCCSWSPLRFMAKAIVRQNWHSKRQNKPSLKTARLPRCLRCLRLNKSERQAGSGTGVEVKSLKSRIMLRFRRHIVKQNFSDQQNWCTGHLGKCAAQFDSCEVTVAMREPFTNICAYSPSALKIKRIVVRSGLAD